MTTRDENEYHYLKFCNIHIQTKFFFSKTQLHRVLSIYRILVGHSKLELFSANSIINKNKESFTIKNQNTSKIIC